MGELREYLGDTSKRPRAIGSFPLSALRYNPTPTSSYSAEGASSATSAGSAVLVGDVFLFPYEGGGTGTADMLARPAENQVWEVAYELSPDWVGKGLGKAMLRAVMTWAELVGIGKIIAVRLSSTLAHSHLLIGSSLNHMDSTDWADGRDSQPPLVSTGQGSGLRRGKALDASLARGEGRR
jgi:GNAT superfamily N-acetyltransferase